MNDLPSAVVQPEWRTVFLVQLAFFRCRVFNSLCAAMLRSGLPEIRPFVKTLRMFIPKKKLLELLYVTFWNNIGYRELR